MRANVCANKVLPEPVGPINKILLLANSTPSTIALAGSLESFLSVTSTGLPSLSSFAFFGLGKY